MSRSPESRRSKSRRGLEPVSNVLDRLLSSARLRQGIANYGLFGRWAEIVGPHLAERTRPLRVQGDVLWVYVESSTQLHHLTFLAPRFVQRIREEAPETTIENIRFTLNPEA